MTIITALDSASATANWQLGAFSDTTGHPSCVTFFEQRLVFAGTTDTPQTHPTCLLYTSPSPRDGLLSRMPSSA